MATRTFLNKDDFSDAQDLLLAPMVPPSSDFWEGQSFPAQEFSSWLSLNVEGRLRTLPSWKEAHPIAIGTWGRGELCPFSDLDVIFCGSEENVKNVIQEAEQLGIDFKYRFPKNPKDWSADSPLFESNALFWARPFTREAAQALQEQKTQIYQKRLQFRKKLLKELRLERKKRNLRHDSIANYLEPHLKFGPGGLRDIDQALMVRFWFPEKLNISPVIFSDLAQLKSFLMTVRQKLHLLGFQDTLVASAQREISQWFGFKTQGEFMRELQNVLARVSFYCDLVFDVATTSEKEIAKVANVKSAQQVFQVLQKNPSLFFQAKVQQFQNSSEFAYSPAIKNFLNVKLSEESLLAMFRSQLLMKVLPEFVKIKGVVQHDQYHRFTVDAHIFQAVRRVLRVFKNPKLIGKLAIWLKTWNKNDWEILLWSALYHDLGKARQKDHSVEGKELVEKDFSRLGFSKAFTDEVAWMVENHLVLSTAAFRKDPHSPKVWQDLYDKGVHG
ncbi:HD domain-containing protein, partial [bacterium]|nr:HD domain-containing protein [bacterium]